MTHRDRPGRRKARRDVSTSDQLSPTGLPANRECPWCGSGATVFVPRGLAGGQQSKDQYIRCHDCDKVTYDIVSKTMRDIRIHRYQPGSAFRDAAHQTRYTIYRMLKVGFDEHLLYLRPVLPGTDESH